jgi:hypothetical protein
MVLGGEPVPAADVPALLRELAPKHKPYAGVHTTCGTQPSRRG